MYILFFQVPYLSDTASFKIVVDGFNKSLPQKYKIETIEVILLNSYYLYTTVNMCLEYHWQFISYAVDKTLILREEHMNWIILIIKCKQLSEFLPNLIYPKWSNVELMEKRKGPNYLSDIFYYAMFLEKHWCVSFNHSMTIMNISIIEINREGPSFHW